MARTCGQPASKLRSDSSQSSDSVNTVCTTPTRQRPPARGSMAHSVRVGGPSSPQSLPSWLNRCGGSQTVILALLSIWYPVW